MKQIEYTEKQKLVLEVLEKVEREFKPGEYAYEYQKKAYFDSIQNIKNAYGICSLYQTLREYLKEHSCGAYHRFYFKIDDITISNITGIEEFERYYNASLLDKYFVLNDVKSETGSNCENYLGEHHLELVRIDK